MTDALTLSEALMELLDRLGEKVHVGIMLPGDVPWAGSYGTLSHGAHRLMDAADDQTIDEETARVRRRFAELVLQRGGRDGTFMVGDMVVPLHTERVLTVQRTDVDVGDRPGLDFAVAAGREVLTVRVTFSEHAR